MTSTQDYTFEVLFEEGDFRLARAWNPDTRKNPELAPPKHGRWVIIQHRCHPDDYQERTFGKDGWSMCWQKSRTCSICRMPAPKAMDGLHNLFMWSNKMDNL